MILVADVNRFPDEYRTELKSILYDLVETHALHKQAHTYMVMAHESNIIDRSQIIDGATFNVIELYRIQLDHVNRYFKFITDNDLAKYLDG